jgi:hypothetical protein
MIEVPYQIWQPVEPNFWGYGDAEERAKIVRKKVYEGTIEVNLEQYDGDVWRVMRQACDRLFEKFNLHHPADFTGHSLSVNDVVVLGESAWMCDPLGWSEIHLEVSNA